MDIQGYLSSGIIESYCLGVASPAEREELDRLCWRYPEIKAEVAAVSRTLEHFAVAHRQTPPPYLKSRILAEISRQKLEENERVVRQVRSIAGKIVEMASLADPLEAAWVCSLTPARKYGNLYRREVFRRGGTVSYALWVKKSVSSRTNAHLVAHFLVLRGAGQLTMDGHSYALEAGDCATVPTNVPYSLRVTSPEPLMVFLQRVAE
ncbi:MAG: cupin domain-containing protein [Ferruginibacter sp.]|nr:cupin domain-containing protein [Cytophagales bacterium]